MNRSIVYNSKNQEIDLLFIIGIINIFGMFQLENIMKLLRMWCDYVMVEKININ